jgi:hypothetical protein
MTPLNFPPGLLYRGTLPGSTSLTVQLHNRPAKTYYSRLQYNCTGNDPFTTYIRGVQQGTFDSTTVAS